MSELWQAIRAARLFGCLRNRFCTQQITLEKTCLVSFWADASAKDHGPNLQTKSLGFRVILGLYWGYIGVELGLNWGYIGNMETEMETTI